MIYEYIRIEVINVVKEVELKDVESVARLNSVACKEGMKITVSKGSILVDARSILALMCLVGSRVNLVAPDNTNPADFARAVNKMSL